MAGSCTKPRNTSFRSPLQEQNTQSTRLTIYLKERKMNRIIYIVGLIVVVLLVLSFLGLR